MTKYWSYFGRPSSFEQFRLNGNSVCKQQASLLFYIAIFGLRGSRKNTGQNAAGQNVSGQNAPWQNATV